MSPISILKDGLIAYVSWTGIHWLTSNLYVKICTPLSGIGFIQTFYLSQSSYCNAFRWVNNITASAMDGAFSIVLTWSVYRLASYSVNYRGKEIKQEQ